MGFLDIIADIAARDDELGETVSSVLEGLFECGHGIADVLDDFTEKLGAVEAKLSGETGEESCWAVDRLAPEWEASPGLTKIRDAVDSIVNFGNKVSEVIEGLTDKIQDMTYGD